MVDPLVIRGMTFVTPNDDGKGYLVWARIGSAWQRYEFAELLSDAMRKARKIDFRLRSIRNAGS